jgi:hypothetical protein
MFCEKLGNFELNAAIYGTLMTTLVFEKNYQYGY